MISEDRGRVDHGISILEVISVACGELLRKIIGRRLIGTIDGNFDGDGQFGGGVTALAEIHLHAIGKPDVDTIFVVARAERGQGCKVIFIR